MTTIRTLIARALVRLAAAAAPAAAQRQALDSALQTLGRGGPGAPD